MREWWNDKDLLDNISEVCLHKELSLNEIVDLVYQDVIRDKYDQLFPREEFKGL